MQVELKANIKAAWWKAMVYKREEVVGIDTSIISSPKIWKASGHVGGFSDPMADCKDSKLRWVACRDCILFVHGQPGLVLLRPPPPTA